MSKKDAFEKNKNRLVKKVAIYTITIILIVAAFVPTASSCHTPGISLPPDYITMIAEYGVTNYFDINLSNVPAGYNVSNGMYPGWCVQRDIFMDRGVLLTVILYSSYDPSLPSVLQDDDWDKINYILNNKQGDRMGIQEAIWYFIDDYDYPTDPDAQALIADANESGEGFCPAPDEITAVIIDNDGNLDYNAQRIIIEVNVPNEEDDDKPVVVTSKSSGRSYSTNLLPVANANGPYDGVIDKEIEFDGSKSYDPDGIITNYSWSFGDGTTGFGEKVTHKYSYGRYFVVELTVLDNSGARDTNKTAVFLRVPNNPPSIPMISGPNGSKDTKYSYAFGSTDPDNDDINYIINWGDGSTNESGFLPSGHFFSMLHSWAKSGEYNITVTASDNQSSSSSEMTILIEDNVIVDNIAIVLLGILALIALMIALMYSKKGKKKK